MAKEIFYIIWIAGFSIRMIFNINQHPKIMKRIKCLTIIAKEWFDRVNGNSYFSARVFVNDAVIVLPFQYGYGDQFLHETHKELIARKLLPVDSAGTCLTRYVRENYGVNVIHSKHENCLQRDVKWYGQEI